MGMAEGEWLNPGTISWRRREPTAVVRTADDAFLAKLSDAIDTASLAKADSLATCRYCADVNGPEFAFGDDCCSSCASHYFGIVFYKGSPCAW